MSIKMSTRHPKKISLRRAAQLSRRPAMSKSRQHGDSNSTLPPRVLSVHMEGLRVGHVWQQQSVVWGRDPEESGQLCDCQCQWGHHWNHCRRQLCWAGQTSQWAAVSVGVCRGVRDVRLDWVDRMSEGKPFLHVSLLYQAHYAHCIIIWCVKLNSIKSIRFHVLVCVGKNCLSKTNYQNLRFRYRFISTHSHAQTDSKNRIELVKSCGMLAGTTLAVGRPWTTGTVSRTSTVWTTTGSGCPGPRVWSTKVTRSVGGVSRRASPCVGPTTSWMSTTASVLRYNVTGRQCYKLVVFGCIFLGLLLAENSFS